MKWIPQGLAFNNAGNLFETDNASGTIYELRPGGARSTFASGMNAPAQLAFQGETLPVPETSALGLLAVGVTAFLAHRRLIFLRCQVACCRTIRDNGSRV
jgi:hypothetical protein